MLISAVTGRETFPSGSCQFQVFALASSRFALQQDTPLGILAGSAQPAIPVTSTGYQRHPAAAGSMVDMGSWHQAIYNVPSGLILKVFGQRSMALQNYGVGRGGPAQATYGALLIQTRDDAALQRITCVTTGDPKASFRSVVIEGRFDFLSLRDAFDAGALTGLSMKLAGQFTNAGNLNRLFQRQRLEREIASKAVVRTTKVQGDDGKMVEVRSAKRPRALDLD